MPKRHQPLRAYRETIVQGPSGHPSAVIRRRVRGRATPELETGPQEPPEAQNGCPGSGWTEPETSGRMGRPPELVEPRQILVNIERSDLDALTRWQRNRGYRSRNAAVRAIIAAVVGRHGE